MALTPREIDALVAEKVMGLEINEEKVFKDGMIVLTTEKPVQIPLPHYSTDISAAWDVAKLLVNNPPEQTDGYYGPYFFVLHKPDKLWGSGYLYDVPYEGYTESDVFAYHKEPTMAICLAALKAVGVNVDD